MMKNRQLTLKQFLLCARKIGYSDAEMFSYMQESDVLPKKKKTSYIYVGSNVEYIDFNILNVIMYMCKKDTAKELSNSWDTIGIYNNMNGKEYRANLKQILQPL